DAGMVGSVFGGVVEGLAVVGAGTGFEEDATERGVVVVAGGAVEGGERVAGFVVVVVEGVGVSAAGEEKADGIDDGFGAAGGGLREEGAESGPAGEAVLAGDGELGGVEGDGSIQARESGGVAGAGGFEQGFGLLAVELEIVGRHATSFQFAPGVRGDGLERRLL